MKKILYGGSIFKTTRRKKPSDEESNLQIEFAHWLNGMDILYCASAGGMRSGVKTGAKMKKMGYKRGFPDIFFYEARSGYNGLAIELKSKMGSASNYQKEWRDALILRGYKAIIMPKGLSFHDGLEWLKKHTKQYLGIK